MSAWWGCAATLVGASHRARNQAGQDAAGVWDDGRLTVVAHSLGTTSAITHAADATTAVGVAVADGHGDRRHYRSGRGAVLAVRAAAGALQPEGPDGVAAALVQGWRRLVAIDVEQEREPVAEDPWTAYGTTVLAASGAGHLLVVVRIGDGEVGLVDDAGGHRPLSPAASSTIGVTASLAGGGPVVVDVVDVLDQGIGAVWLATDGFTTAQAEQDWRSVVAAQLHERLLRDGPAHVGRHLPEWLAPAAADGGDDVSLALLVPPSTARMQKRTRTTGLV